MTKIAVAGAGGRMGRTLIEACNNSKNQSWQQLLKGQIPAL